MATKTQQTAETKAITNGLSFDNLTAEQKVALMELVNKTGGDFSRLTIKQLDPESAEYKAICEELKETWTKEAESRGVDPKHVFATTRKAPTVYANPNKPSETFQYGKKPAWFTTIPTGKTEDEWHAECAAAAAPAAPAPAH